MDSIGYITCFRWNYGKFWQSNHLVHCANSRPYRGPPYFRHQFINLCPFFVFQVKFDLFLLVFLDTWWSWIWVSSGNLNSTTGVDAANGLANIRKYSMCLWAKTNGDSRLTHESSFANPNVRRLIYSDE